VVRNQVGMVALLLRHRANVQLDSMDGTPLDVAIKKGAKDIIKLLLGAKKR
jgi:ankyrin repeat protein